MDKTRRSKAKLSIMTAMLIYGTIGVFVKYIPLSSSMIALARGFFGAVFLGIYMLIRREKFSVASIKNNWLKLLLSGAMLGFNWLLLFEAYNYTTVATATLCYYLAPVIIVAVSPIFLKERLNIRKIICIAVALFGMVLISGILSNGVHSGEIRGIVYGLLSAVLYAGIVITNKKMSGISSYERTASQLLVSSVVMLPYALIVNDISSIHMNVTGIILLAVVSLVHTGIAYVLYFGSVRYVSSQTVAILGYIDPVVAVLLSVFLLKETITVYGIIGAVLVIAAAIVSELPVKKK